jgi:hypothetical protein
MVIEVLTGAWLAFFVGLLIGEALAELGAPP